MLFKFMPVLIFTTGIFLPIAAAQDACPADFAGNLPPRLVVGERARVLAGITLNVRPQPTTALARVASLPPGATFDVTAGPTCADGFVWWAAGFGQDVGWVAEGTVAGGEYWLEPRGEAVVQQDVNGVPRRFVRDADGTLEREGCLRPPDDYTISQQGFARVNARTLAMLGHAQRLYENAGGSNLVNFRTAITQGSYNPGAVAASFGTHDGGGAVDLSVRSYLDSSVLADEIEPMIDALRVAGFAAWLRAPGELYDDSPIHIHAIAIGDREASGIAQAQVDGPFGYLRGYNGLPQPEGAAPIIDRHVGPIVCGWMVELGFEDLREAVER